MGSCLKCGSALAKTEEAGGICYPCENKLSPLEKEELLGVKATNEEIFDEEARKQAALATKQKNEMLLTTEMCPTGINVKDRLGIVTAECVFGMNAFRDLFAGVRDIVGGRSGAMQKVFKDARKTVLDELKEEAFSVGGNAVIAVDIQYIEISKNSGGSMLMVAATGTSVVIDKPSE